MRGGNASKTRLMRWWRLLTYSPRDSLYGIYRKTPFTAVELGLAAVAQRHSCGKALRPAMLGDTPPPYVVEKICPPQKNTTQPKQFALAKTWHGSDTQFGTGVRTW